MTLLMSTGLTFGTISSLYGLNAGIIDQHAVLAAGHGRRAVGDRPDRDRAALVLTRSAVEDEARRARFGGPAEAAAGAPGERA